MWRKCLVNFMRTYTDHYKSINLLRKEERPILRSSAIFPFFVNKDLDTRILFLGYWFLKRNIKEILITITIRLEKGEIINRENFNIDSVKAFCISIKKKLKKKNIFITANLKGSIEIEVFSTKNLVYPYPAFVVNYDSRKSSTFTHTCGRIFNDIDDYKKTLKFLPPETGFDILPNVSTNPFFSFVNGNIFLKNQKINLEIFCNNKKIIKKKIFIKKINPYETKFVFFLNNNEKKKFARSLL